MKTLNRAAFLVRPREPYLRWAAGLDAEAPAAAEGLDDRTAVYLVPADPRGEEETPPLEEFFAEIFEEELGAWSTDPTQWPARRDLSTFRDWFEVVGESIVVDLAEGSIKTEEF